MTEFHTVLTAGVPITPQARPSTIERPSELEALAKRCRPVVQSNRHAGLHTIEYLVDVVSVKIPLNRLDFPNWLRILPGSASAW